MDASCIDNKESSGICIYEDIYFVSYYKAVFYDDHNPLSIHVIYYDAHILFCPVVLLY